MAAHSPPTRSTPANIAIVTDGAADVPAIERGSGVRWDVLAEVWRGGKLELPDMGEHNRELVRLVLAGPGLQVAEPGIDDFRRAYAALESYERVWSVHAARSVSGAVESAREAAGGVPNVRVVEAPAAGIGVGLVAARIRDLARDGASVEAIDDYLRKHAASVRFLVVPDRFDPVGQQRAFSATLLAGRPMLSAQDGSVSRGRRLRSRRATVEAIERHLATHALAGRPMRMAVGHGDAAGAVDPFLDIVERMHPEATIDLVGRIGPRLVAHLGSRCVGMAWILE